MTQTAHPSGDPVTCDCTCHLGGPWARCSEEGGCGHRHRDEACPTCEHSPCLGVQSTIPDGERCVLAHRRQPCRPRRAVSGLYVCGGHRTGLARNLGELGGMHERLAERHLAGQGGLGARRRPGHTGLPAPDRRVAIARDNIYTELSGWARDLHDRRGFTLPTDTVPAIAAYLRGYRDANVDWWCTHPAVDEFYDAVEHLSREAFRLLYPTGRRRFPIRLPDGSLARCLEAVSCDVATRAEHRCKGRMIATITDQDDLMPSAMWCDECGVEITADRWITYGRRVHKAMETV